MFAQESLLEQMRLLSVEEVLRPLLIQLVVIIATARLFAILARRLGQPAVVGEILAGILLGPSVFGLVAPQLFQTLFHPTLGELTPEASELLLSNLLTVLSQIGLILLLFLVGLEFDFSHLQYHGRTATVVAITGLVIPFALGVLLALAIYSWLPESPPLLGFLLFLGTSMAITAMPVLGRMMQEWGITRTRLATITITAAAAEDACGWILLASVAAISRAEFQFHVTLLMILGTLGFVVILWLARPGLHRFARLAVDRNSSELTPSGFSVLLVLIFLSALVTNVIGIFAIFGAFLLGAVLSTEQRFAQAVHQRLREMVTGFFLPLFFTYTGLRTNLGSLETWQLWAIAALVLAVAVMGKLGGCAGAGWLSGLKLREAACVGAMMNTRGLMELIVINVGKDLGVIPDSIYCMLVLMAVLTTLMTAPLVMLFMRGTELETAIREVECRRQRESAQTL